MNWKEELFDKAEKPLDRLVDSYSNTAIFRTMAFVGDSLSSGEFEFCDENNHHQYYDFYEYSWGQHIARKNGLKAYNFSRGGMTAKEYIESFAEEKGFWDTEKACQAYVIALGVNDLFKGMALGSVDDINVDDYTQNKPTFAGYYAMIISKYKAISPDAKFFFVTFPKVCGEEKIAVGMVDLLYKLSEIFDNSYVIDLYNYAPKYDKEFHDRYFWNSHMNPMGYILTAKIVDSYIDYIIRHNSKDFDRVAFINASDNEIYEAKLEN